MMPYIRRRALLRRRLMQVGGSFIGLLLLGASRRRSSRRRWRHIRGMKHFRPGLRNCTPKDTTRASDLGISLGVHIFPRLPFFTIPTSHWCRPPRSLEALPRRPPLEAVFDDGVALLLGGEVSEADELPEGFEAFV